MTNEIEEGRRVSANGRRMSDSFATQIAQAAIISALVAEQREIIVLQREKIETLERLVGLQENQIAEFKSMVALQEKSIAHYRGAR